MAGMTLIEQWWFIAAFLPVVVGFIIQKGWSKRVQSTVAIAVYTAYGLIGAWLSGQFSGLAWSSAIDVATSVMMVIIIGSTSYASLWKAFPIPQWIEAHSGGDPMVEVVPRKNVM